MRLVSAIEVDKLLQAVLCILVRLVMAVVVEVMLEMMVRVMIHAALRRTLINQGTRQPGASHDWSILLTLETRWAGPRHSIQRVVSFFRRILETQVLSSC